MNQTSAGRCLVLYGCPWPFRGRDDSWMGQTGTPIKKEDGFPFLATILDDVISTSCVHTAQEAEMMFTEMVAGSAKIAPPQQGPKTCCNVPITYSHILSDNILSYHWLGQCRLHFSLLTVWDCSCFVVYFSCKYISCIALRAGLSLIQITAWLMSSL